METNADLIFFDLFQGVVWPQQAPAENNLFKHIDHATNAYTQSFREKFYLIMSQIRLIRRIATRCAALQQLGPSAGAQLEVFDT